MEPASDRERSLFYNVVVLHEMYHSRSSKDQSSSADNGNNEQTETLITDTRNNRTDRYAKEIRCTLHIVDYLVTIVLITEFAGIDPVISEEIERLPQLHKEY